MYHEYSEHTRKKRRTHAFAVVLVLFVLAIVCALGYRSVRSSLNEQAALSMRQSIMDAAMQCCAIEGSYPLSLDHLEQNYGLTINREDFIITYQAYANNVAPSVVVIPR